MLRSSQQGEDLKLSRLESQAAHHDRGQHPCPPMRLLCGVDLTSSHTWNYALDMPCPVLTQRLAVPDNVQQDAILELHTVGDGYNSGRVYHLKPVRSPLCALTCGLISSTRKGRKPANA
eukprot:2050362-Rhodomonas_salina.1